MLFSQPSNSSLWLVRKRSIIIFLLCLSLTHFFGNFLFYKIIYFLFCHQGFVKTFFFLLCLTNMVVYETKRVLYVHDNPRIFFFPKKKLVMMVVQIYGLETLFSLILLRYSIICLTTIWFIAWRRFRCGLLFTSTNRFLQMAA